MTTLINNTHKRKSIERKTTTTTTNLGIRNRKRKRGTKERERERQVMNEKRTKMGDAKLS